MLMINKKKKAKLKYIYSNIAPPHQYYIAKIQSGPTNPTTNRKLKPTTRIREKLKQFETG